MKKTVQGKVFSAAHYNLPTRTCSLRTKWRHPLGCGRQGTRLSLSKLLKPFEDKKVKITVEEVERK